MSVVNFDVNEFQERKYNFKVLAYSFVNLHYIIWIFIIQLTGNTITFLDKPMTCSTYTTWNKFGWSLNYNATPKTGYNNFMPVINILRMDVEQIIIKPHSYALHRINFIKYPEYYVYSYQQDHDIVYDFRYPLEN